VLPQEFIIVYGNGMNGAAARMIRTLKVQCEHSHRLEGPAARNAVSEEASKAERTPTLSSLGHGKRAQHLQW
jgi:hypothetical protein